MIANFKTHRTETRLDVERIAGEFRKDLHDGLAASRAESKTANRWTWGLIVAVAVGLAGLILRIPHVAVAGGG